MILLPAPPKRHAMSIIVPKLTGYPQCRKRLEPAVILDAVATVF